MAQTFFPIDPVDVTPVTTGAWTDVDISAYAPAGATGALLHCYNTDYSGWELSLRKKGSTDNYVSDLGAITHCWAAIGVDADRKFQAYIGTDSVHILLVGYTMSGVTFLTNSVDKSPASLGVWADMDCSAEAPNAIGLIFWIETIAVGRHFGLRKKGSTDARTNLTNQFNCFGAIIGCDASQVCQGYRDANGIFLRLVGYITDGATFNTNATDVSLGSTGSWLDLAALPGGAVMGFIEVVNTGGYNYGLRKNGSSENIIYAAYMHPWAFVQCDSGGVIEGQISNLNVDFFLVGYAIGPLQASVYDTEYAYV